MTTKLTFSPWVSHFSSYATAISLSKINNRSNKTIQKNLSTLKSSPENSLTFSTKCWKKTPQRDPALKKSQLIPLSKPDANRSWSKESTVISQQRRSNSNLTKFSPLLLKILIPLMRIKRKVKFVPCYLNPDKSLTVKALLRFIRSTNRP